MKALIAISSCGDFERNGNNQAMRDTWLPQVRMFSGLDYRFFFGVGQHARELDDAIVLPDVQDDYANLTYKTRASLRWAHAQGYDFVFRCFPDTLVRVERLMAYGFEKYDYLGDFRGDVPPPGVTLQQAGDYASGGPGYWLSRRAFDLLLDAPVLGVWRDEITTFAEDLWTGRILGQHPVTLAYRDEQHKFVNRGSCKRAWPYQNNDVISSHLSCPIAYNRSVMYAAHRAFHSFSDRLVTT
jgi:hypothetical protein